MGQQPYYPFQPGGPAGQQPMPPQAPAFAPGANGPAIPPGLMGLPPEALNDPRIRALIAQSLANPHQDQFANQQQQQGQQPQQEPFSLLPGTPKDWLIGAGAGLGISTGVNRLFFHNQAASDYKRLTGVAKFIDGLPGIGWLNDKLKDRVVDPMLNNKPGSGAAPSWKRLLTQDEWLHVLDKLPPQEAERMIMNRYMDGVEQGLTRKSWFGLGKPITDDATAKNVITKLKTHFTDPKSGITIIKDGAVNQDAIDKALAKVRQEFISLDVLKADAKGSWFTKSVKDQLANLAKEAPDIEKKLFNGAKNLDDVARNLANLRSSGAITTDVSQKAQWMLDTMDKRLARLAEEKLGKPLSRAITSVASRVKGLGMSHMESMTYRYGLMQAAEKQGVGPIGKMFMSITDDLRRVFGGDAAVAAMGISNTAASQVKKSWFGQAKEFLGKTVGRAIGPMLSGMFIFGFALGETGKAEKGDKLSTFMHHFLGAGLAGWLSWEIIRRNVNKVSLVTKALTKIAPRMMTVMLPFTRLTWVGLITEIAATMILAYPFQKVAEKLSHLMFGKPKSLEKEESANKSPQPGADPNAAITGQPGAAAGQSPNGQNPTQQANPTQAMTPLGQPTGQNQAPLQQTQPQPLPQTGQPQQPQPQAMVQQQPSPEGLKPQEQQGYPNQPSQTQQQVLPNIPPESHDFVLDPDIIRKNVVRQKMEHVNQQLISGQKDFNKSLIEQESHYGI